MKNANGDIRKLIKDYRLHYDEISEKLYIAPSSLNNLLCSELTEKKRNEIFNVIENIKHTPYDKCIKYREESLKYIIVSSRLKFKEVAEFLNISYATMMNLLKADLERKLSEIKRKKILNAVSELKKSVIPD